MTLTSCFLAADEDAVVVGHDAGGGDDVAGELLADGLDVGDLDVVGVGVAASATGVRVVGEDDVRADALDLLEDVVAAGERDGDHQDDGGGPDDHAERGEQRADGIGAERLPTEVHRFREEESAPAGGCRHSFIIAAI